MFKLNINKPKPDADLKQDLKQEIKSNNLKELNKKELELKEFKSTKKFLAEIAEENNLYKKQIENKFHKNKKKYRKNEILHNKKIFDKALDNLVKVNLTAIENKTEKLNSEIDLDLLLQAESKEFKPLMTQYCNKTGKELHSVKLDDLKTLLAVHGKERSLELMQLDACSKYSPLWLHSEPKTLNKLMYFDAQGFFIYAASHIFHSNIIKKSNLSTKPPMSQAGKESTEDKNLLDFLADFPEQDKPDDFFSNEIPAHTSVRYFNLQDKIIGYRNLSLYHIEKDIIECNELLRRFLGLANPEKVANLIKFSFSFLHEITEDENSLRQFKEELKTALKTLFETHFKKVKHKKSEGYAIRLQKERLHSGTVAEIKAKFGGLSNFHKQPNIKNQNAKESILFDLKEFWDKETEQDDLLKDFSGRGNSFAFDANSQGLDCKTGAPLNRHKAPKSGFKLNLNK